jgi:hypothetical protein
LQAADLLAAQIHVQDVCSVLATRLFASVARRLEESNQQDPTQVLLSRIDVLVAEFYEETSSL